MNRWGVRWHKDQVRRFAQARPSYQALAELLAEVLHRAAAKYAPLAIVQVRAKTLSSFAEKALRKLPDPEAALTYRSSEEWLGHFDPVSVFTDLCGGRVIAQTQPEVEALSRFIEDSFLIDWENSEDKRAALASDRFGYLSVHYIVSLPSTSRLLGVAVPRKLAGLKAEIQVRTMLQHAWAGVSHDSLYKNQFKVPELWQREMSRLAAVLEAADHEFSNFARRLESYATEHGAYLSEEQLGRELTILDTVLKNERRRDRRKGLILRKAALHEARHEWASVAGLLGPWADKGGQEVWKRLGRALCRLHRAEPESAAYRQGQELLAQAARAEPNDAEAWFELAWSWEQLDQERAYQDYAKAYGLRPADPYYLSAFLEFSLGVGEGQAHLELLEPVMRQAARRCREHIDMGLELPRAWFTLGRLHLLLQEPYLSLEAYSAATALCLDKASGAPRQALSEELGSLARLRPLASSLEGYHWMRRLLLLGDCLARKEEAASSLAALKRLATKGAGYDPGQAHLVVAGTCDPKQAKTLRAYRPLVTACLEHFRGVVISGGTDSGVAGLVAEARSRREGAAFRAVGYHPHPLPADARADQRYDQLWTTAGRAFSPLEPLQMWVDLVVSGVDPGRVKVVGVGGGRVSAAEYRMALALGAEVGVAQGSGRAVKGLVNDPVWQNHPRLLHLPDDPMTFQAFVLPPLSRLSEGELEIAARSSHDKSRAKLKDKDLAPNKRSWEGLDPKFRRSSVEQKRYAETILRLHGYGLRRAENPDAGFTFPPRVLERMAEMEHGRWNVERIGSGWRPGPVGDVDRKRSPSLLPWQQLPDEERKKDRSYVARWPQDFAAVGLEVFRREPGED